MPGQAMCVCLAIVSIGTSPGGISIVSRLTAAKLRPHYLQLLNGGAGLWISCGSQ